MEHVIIKEMTNGYHRIIPDKGYMLAIEDDPNLHNDAVVKDITTVTVVKI